MTRQLIGSRSLIPALAKWTVLLGGFAYTGFVSELFKQELGWHRVPVGLLLLLGSLQVALWLERRLAKPVS